MTDKIRRLFELQRKSYLKIGASTWQQRKEKLQKMRSLLHKHTNKFVEALKKDFSKPEAETLLTEILLLDKELKHTIKNLRKWMKDEPH